MGVTRYVLGDAGTPYFFWSLPKLCFHAISTPPPMLPNVEIKTLKSFQPGKIEKSKVLLYPGKKWGHIYATAYLHNSEMTSGRYNTPAFSPLQQHENSKSN